MSILTLFNFEYKYGNSKSSFKLILIFVYHLYYRDWNTQVT